MSLEDVPRWQQAIQNGLEKDKNSNVYQLATTDLRYPQTLAVPRVRSLIHRAFLSPLSPSHPLLLTTTDIRTPKVGQIAQNSTIELAWWVAPTQEQFRISGKAYIMPARDFSAETDALVQTADGADALREGERAHIGAAAAQLAGEFPSSELGGEEFDWEAKRREIFDGMSGHMKASWVRPVPGTPLAGGYEAAKKWPESLSKLGEAKDEEGKKAVQDALKNFALVVIDPTEVDHVELGVVPNRRTKFSKNKNGKWVEGFVVP